MDDVTAVLTCLADATRRRVLETLSGSAGRNAGEIARDVGISRQGVLKHLAVLADAGLITSRRAGREVLFAVRAAPLRTTAAWMQDLADEWDRQLAALKRAAERE